MTKAVVTLIGKGLSVSANQNQIWELGVLFYKIFKTLPIFCGRLKKICRRTTLIL